MGKPLRVLLVEDVERDALLLVRELQRGGFDVTCERVDTREAMSVALEELSWDIVISDYVLPRFSAPQALALVKERKLDLPFIIVSGTVGEETAVESIRAGAHDFMAKGKFARLIPSVERELRDAVLRNERSRMQEQLLISDRMASVGTLAAGVAHEINNPLAALMANLSFAAEEIAKLGQDVREKESGATSDSATIDWIAVRLHELEEPLRDARESGDRIRLIVRDLKIFSRGDEEKRSAVDVRRVLETSLRMAWNEIRHRARLVKDYGNVPPVEGNEGRLGQVFLNLIVNAAQAMPEGRADQNEIRITTRQDDEGRVVVEVRDTGCGIPESVLHKVFDPFFTTKPIGVGTGLGLGICHRIVTAMGGQILVESQVGKGTVIQTVLPVALADTHAVTTPPVALVARPRGRILVVDDEPMIGAAVRRMLSREHEVLAVTSAREAIGRLSQGERFDVILCDLMMPDMTGRAFYAELSRLAPEQAEKVIFMTGDTFSSRAREFLDQVRNPRVEKPFDVGVLKALVQSLLR